MKANIKIIVVLILSILPFVVQSQMDLDENGRPRFSITSSTIILDGEGNVIDFSSFIKLNPGVDYNDLSPKFNSSGELENITIHLARPIVKKQEPVIVAQSRPLPSTTTTTTTRTYQNPTTTPSYPKEVRTHTMSTNERKKKFRFTTAKELEELQAPYFNEKDVNGKTYSSTNLLGNIIVIKFWFLKCGPCLEEIPELNKLVAKYQHRSDVKFLAAATDDYEAVKKFLEKKDFKYTMLYDTYDIHGDFKVAGYPTHMIIHKNGTVAKVYTGKNSTLAETMSEVIDQSLMMQPDDKSMVEIPQPLYTSDKIFRAEEGFALSKEQYLKKLSTGMYKIFKKIKIDGSEEIFLMRK